MGLRDDFRNAMNTIFSAAADATHTMRHGEDEIGTVVQSSSREFSEDLTGDTPVEAARFIANAADFPGIRKGSAVELAGEVHVVTSARTDPVGASLTLGLSAPLDKTRVSYTRRGGRPFPMSVLALEDASVPSAYADAAGPIEGQTWTVCVVATEWMETSAPAAGDEIRIFSDRLGEDIRLRVASVVADGGWWTLRARPRGLA